MKALRDRWVDGMVRWSEMECLVFGRVVEASDELCHWARREKSGQLGGEAVQHAHAESLYLGRDGGQPAGEVQLFLGERHVAEIIHLQLVRDAVVREETSQQCVRVRGGGRT